MTKNAEKPIIVKLSVENTSKSNNEESTEFRSDLAKDSKEWSGLSIVDDSFYDLPLGDFEIISSKSRGKRPIIEYNNFDEDIASVFVDQTYNDISKFLDVYANGFVLGIADKKPTYSFLAGSALTDHLYGRNLKNYEKPKVYDGQSKPAELRVIKVFYDKLTKDAQGNFFEAAKKSTLRNLEGLLHEGNLKKGLQSLTKVSDYSCKNPEDEGYCYQVNFQLDLDHSNSIVKSLLQVPGLGKVFPKKKVHATIHLTDETYFEKYIGPLPK